MPKANLEYFPHIVDMIFEHIPACALHIASQVCSSWRTRAEEVYLQHLIVKPYGTGWKFSIKKEFVLHQCLEYYMPCGAPQPHPPLLYDPYRQTQLREHHRPLLPEMTPLVQILDVFYYDIGYKEETAYRLLLDQFKNLQVTRGTARCYFPMRGAGETQVFFVSWEDCLHMQLSTGPVQTLVLSFSFSDDDDDDVLRGNPLQTLLLTQSGNIGEIVFVLWLDMLRGDRERAMAYDLAEVLRKCWKSAKVGKVTMVGFDPGQVHLPFKARLSSELGDAHGDSRLKLLSHTEYEALVGTETYNLHCVWDQAKWKPLRST